MRISFDEKWACQQFWHDRWDHNSNFSILLGCIFLYKNQQCKPHSSQHLSHVSELKNPKQNRQSKMSSCNIDLASMTWAFYQKRLSNNRRFLLSNRSQHKTLSNFDSALIKEQQQIGSKSKPLVPSLPTKSGGIYAVSSAGKILPSGMENDKMQTVSDPVLQVTGYVNTGLYLQEVQCSWGCSKSMEEIFEILSQKRWWQQANASCREHTLH